MPYIISHEYRDLNDKQRKALENLENAFKKCGKLGFRFSGVDYNLVWALFEGDVDTLEEEYCDRDYDMHDEMEEVGKAGRVSTYNAYLDSGGR